MTPLTNAVPRGKRVNCVQFEVSGMSGVTMHSSENIVLREGPKT